MLKTSKVYEEIGYLPFVEEQEAEERFAKLRKILHEGYEPWYASSSLKENFKCHHQAHSMSRANRA